MAPPRETVPIGIQSALMRRHFPSFRYENRRRPPAWFGTLRPAEWSREFKIRIDHPAPDRTPKVWVTAPPVHPKAPHRYGDGSLCLDYPKDGREERWHPGAPLAWTVVPWTAEWLFYYELWLETGDWYGEAAPHGGGRKV